MAEVRARTGLSARQIRYYDQRGLVVAARSRGGHRLYADAQIDRLLAVKALLAAGRSLTEVAAQLDPPRDETDAASLEGAHPPSA